MPDERNWPLLGWAVAERRQVLKITQTELGEEAHVSVNTVSRLETGKPLREGNLDKIASYLFGGGPKTAEALLHADRDLERIMRLGPAGFTYLQKSGELQPGVPMKAPHPAALLGEIYFVRTPEVEAALLQPGVDGMAEEQAFDELNLPLSIGVMLKDGDIKDWRTEHTPDGSIDIVTLAVSRHRGPTKRDLGYWLALRDSLINRAAELRAEAEASRITPGSKEA